MSIVGGITPWAGILDCTDVEEKWNISMVTSTLFPDCGCCATCSLKPWCGAFPAVTGCHGELGTKTNPFSLKLLLSRCFVTAARK